ncbi:undecaprenyl-diphosphate phosphatase [Acetobacter oeni]|uniref:Undecaprenyl-diphosphatase n=1 Tax=Acetobacter oeni TaxID=304077 RepID=A0A511XHP1_9PROT|nr:undecaprenyl-diphosphate phosphatase [Acetobacter oeni]MBB3881307.1 undecaprenyl-diphosphatase [Acetobacter oeni]NHO18180.1 undecaprenyl-diphosphate phosphatase [Acetobacter oeni]GBR08025.1 UDP pyrophosphate phosphatase [Acetobacter oeni LMG 21952]GEN62462.1 undecaprenyl-diphosphatase 1 [Acetobacter oeni]
MTLLQALIIAILQGATELFPVSSLGHAVLLPALLHWPFNESDEIFLPFLVMLHLGTSVALFIFFWRDWAAIITGALGIHGSRYRVESFKILWLLAIATLPAVIVGAALEHILRHLFGSPLPVAGLLVVNGLLLLAVERLRGRFGPATTGVPEASRPVASLTARDALFIGCFQCLALFPGLSRSGATIAGGLLRGLHHDVAARFSFLMAEPIILAATAHQMMKMRHMTITHDQIHIGLIAAVVSGITALISTGILMRYFRNHDNWALAPFAYYCIAFGLGSLVVLGGVL